MIIWVTNSELQGSPASADLHGVVFCNLPGCRRSCNQTTKAATGRLVDHTVVWSTEETIHGLQKEITAENHASRQWMSWRQKIACLRVLKRNERVSFSSTGSVQRYSVNGATVCFALLLSKAKADPDHGAGPHSPPAPHHGVCWGGAGLYFCTAKPLSCAAVGWLWIKVDLDLWFSSVVLLKYIEISYLFTISMMNHFVALLMPLVKPVVYMFHQRQATRWTHWGFTPFVQAREVPLFHTWSQVC